MKGANGLPLIKSNILQNRKIARDIYFLEVDYSGALEKPGPGQFYNILTSGSTDPLLRRPISVGRFHEGRLGFYYKVVGRGTENMTRMRPGETVDMMGPLGNTFPQTSGRAFLIGGGIGIAPLLYLAEKILDSGGEVSMALGYRTADDVYHDFAADIRNRCDVDIYTEDGTMGYKGYPTDGIANKKEDILYCCGPDVMMRAVESAAAPFFEDRYYSLEENMACGIGACLGCAVKTKKGMKMVCKDGPVFPGKELLWT